jgi:BASS family bile acid:Na+ symporter
MFASKVLNLFVVGLTLVGQYPLLVEIRPRGFAGMLVFLAASWTSGWLLGGRAIEGRTAMAITTALRNFSVGLVIATEAFAGTPAITAVVAYGLMSLLVTLASATLLGARHDPAVQLATAGGSTESAPGSDFEESSTCAKIDETADNS